MTSTICIKNKRLIWDKIYNDLNWIVLKNIISELSKDIVLWNNTKSYERNSCPINLNRTTNELNTAKIP